MSPNFQPNPNKNLNIQVGSDTFARFPIKTPVIKTGDDVGQVLQNLVGKELQKDDALFVSEKIIAISQGRAYKISDIHPSWLAKFLVRFVHKSKYGIGLGSPWTMELALRDVGAPRILFAAFCAALTKPFGIRGVFYHVAGKDVNAIDGPCDYTLPPYNEYAKLGPKNPNEEAKKISEKLSVPVVIIDANDLGVNILGRSSTEISEDWAKAIFKDNPLGQGSQQTPAALVRKIN
jgi:F420-0:gamma-glutamyl ligase-like protein